MIFSLKLFLLQDSCQNLQKYVWHILVKELQKLYLDRKNNFPLHLLDCWIFSSFFQFVFNQTGFRFLSFMSS